MQITGKEVIGGRSILEVRTLLKHLQTRLVLTSDVPDILDVPEKETKKLIKTLADEGYIEIDKTMLKGTPVCVNTVKGAALSMASTMKPIKRKNAERLVNEFLERVKELNRNEKFILKVEKVLIFGSYLSDKEVLGDIDLAFDLVPKAKDADEFGRQNEEKMREARRLGKCKTFMEQLFYANRECELFLRAKSRYLSFHSGKEGVLKIAKSEVLYMDKVEQAA